MKSISCLAVLFFIVPGCDRALLGEGEHLRTLAENLAPPPMLDDGLQVSTLSAEGIDEKAIEGILSFYHDNPHYQRRSLLIARNNKLVLESYFNGWNRERKQDLRSASKSFTSALVGIAIDKGFISGVGERVYDYFPEYAQYENPDPRKEQMTVRDFLRMRAGFACNDLDPSSRGNEEFMYETEDWVKFILDLPVVADPGERFSYCTGAPVTLGSVVAKASGMSAADFARQFLFEPLGIVDYSLEYRPDGQADTGGHFHLTPRDMLKFGLLFLNKGVWQGRRIISEEWVEESTAGDGAVPYLENIDYGYLWYATVWRVDERDVLVYFANGNGGQNIFVAPSLNLTVVFTGGAYNKPVLPAILNAVHTIVSAAD